MFIVSFLLLRPINSVRSQGLDNVCNASGYHSLTLSRSYKSAFYSSINNVYIIQPFSSDPFDAPLKSKKTNWFLQVTHLKIYV